MEKAINEKEHPHMTILNPEKFIGKANQKTKKSGESLDHFFRENTLKFENSEKLYEWFCSICKRNFTSLTIQIDPLLIENKSEPTRLEQKLN